MMRKKIWIFAAVAGTAGLCATLLYASGPLLVKPYLEHKLRQSGFPKSNIEAATIMPQGVLLENVYLDPEGFSTIDAIQIKTSWSDLILKREIDTISVKNIELSGELDEQGQLVIAGWDATPLSAGGGMLIRNINLDGLTLDLETPEGAIRAEGKLMLQDTGTGQRDFQASLWGKQKQLSLTVTASGALQADGSWAASAEINDGRIDLSGIKASRASGKIALSGKPGSPVAYSGEFAAGGLKIKDIPFQDTSIYFDSTKPEVATFKTSPTGYGGILIEGHIGAGQSAAVRAAVTIKDLKDLEALLEMKKGEMAWLADIDPLALRLEAPVSALSAQQVKLAWKIEAGQKPLLVQGDLVVDKATSDIAGTLSPLEVSGADLTGLLPLQAMADVRLDKGTLAASGTFSYKAGADMPELKSDISLKADGLGGTWQDYPVEDINGAITFTRLYPWEIGKPALITLSAIGTGINLSEGRLKLQGSAAKGTKISEASFVASGGRISLRPFTWSFTAKENLMTVDLENIDIARLIEDAKAEGLSGEGTLSGSVPLQHSKKGGLSFREGAIASLGQGKFRYTPATYPSALQGSDARMETVRQALSDFHYTSLEIDLNGELDGNLRTSLKASGTSPLFGDRPINLNINLEGALVPALQQALQPGRIASTIEKSITGDRQ